MESPRGFFDARKPVIPPYARHSPDSRRFLRLVILNSEMKTTDYTECTDTEDLAQQVLFIQQVNGALLAIPHSICAHL
jgi:hypothetical protein